MQRDAGATRRRLGLLAARGHAALPGKGLNRPCLFLHLPKCGGTSLTRGLAGTVPLHRRIGAVDALATRRAAAMLHSGRDDLLHCHEELAHGARTFVLREGLALTYLAAGLPLIHGHVLLTDALLTASENLGYGLVTMIREPRARTLSNYRMAVRAGVIPDDVEAWLASPVGLRMARQMLRYLSGHPDPARIEDPATALRIAQTRLARFALIGELERPTPFLNAFAREFGVKPRLPRLNRATGPELRLTPEQSRRLDVLLAPDLEIYATAVGCVAKGEALVA